MIVTVTPLTLIEYLHAFLLRLNPITESGKPSMRADMALFWFGVIVSIKSPNKYLYEPSSKVCKHSTGVLLFGESIQVFEIA